MPHNARRVRRRGRALGALDGRLLLDARAFGYPIRSLSALPRGRYRVQAVLNRYETFRLADGRVLSG